MTDKEKQIEEERMYSEGFSTRFVNSVLRNDLTLDKVMKMDDMELLNLNSFGRGCLNSLKEYKKTHKEEVPSVISGFKKTKEMKLLIEAFPGSRIANGMFILKYRKNEIMSFIVDSDMKMIDIKAKVLNWVSKPILDTNDMVLKNLLIADLNYITEHDFTLEDVRKMYEHLYGGKSKEKTLSYILSGYNSKVLV